MWLISFQIIQLRSGLGTPISTFDYVLIIFVAHTEYFFLNSFRSIKLGKLVWLDHQF